MDFNIRTLKVLSQTLSFISHLLDIPKSFQVHPVNIPGKIHGYYGLYLLPNLRKEKEKKLSHKMVAMWGSHHISSSCPTSRKGCLWSGGSTSRAGMWSAPADLKAVRHLEKEQSWLKPPIVERAGNRSQLHLAGALSIPELYTNQMIQAFITNRAKLDQIICQEFLFSANLKPNLIPTEPNKIKLS